MKKTRGKSKRDWLARAKARRFEVIKMRVRRGDKGSSVEVANHLDRLLKKNQHVIYLKHNTLVGNWAYWTAIVENR